MDHPEVRTVLDVRTGTRDDVLTAWVTAVADDELVVTVGQDASGRRVRLDVGEQLSLAWRGPDLVLEMPAELLTVLQTGDGEPAWRLRPLGRPARMQRRDAVRAALDLPVVLRIGSAEVRGTTVDLSEGGLRCVLPTSGSGVGQLAQLAAASGELELTVDLGAQQVTADARVVRDHRSLGVLDLSVAFVDLPERSADVIRARVFVALREQRARQLG